MQDSYATAKSFRDFFLATASPEDLQRLEKIRAPRMREHRPVWNDFISVGSTTVRIPSSATIDRKVDLLRNDHIIPLLVDENVAGTTTLFLRNHNLGAIHVGRTFMQARPDEDIYAIGSRLDVMIVTHDRDYLDRSRFDPYASPGVFILPHGVHGEQNPDNCRTTRAALEHLVRNFPRTSCMQRGTFHEYRRSGGLLSYEPPFRPDPNDTSRSLPVAFERYIPS